MPIWLIQLLVGVVLSVASTLIQSALTPKQTQQAQAGFRGSVQTGGKVPVSFLVGTIGSAGKLEYRNTWGSSGSTPNAYLTDVISFGDLPISAFTGLFVDMSAVTVSASGHTSQGYPVPEKANAGSDRLWWEFYDGSQVSASSFLTSTFGSDAVRPWTSSFIGRGVPYLTMTALIDPAIWTGFPSYVGVFQGVKLYDPRLDTTAGGSGSQRFGTYSTYAFTDNPIVIIYNILRGITDPITSKHLWGSSARASQMPFAVWKAAMDACDASVNLAAGGTEKRFRAGREIFVNEVPADVIQELLTGANARIAMSAGVYYVLVGVPSSADFTFTDADVIVSQSTQLDPFPNLDSIVNGATATYLEPSQAWQSKDTAPYYRSDLEAADDNRRQLVGLSLNTTFSGTQAQRILQASVEESRRFVRHVIPLTPGFGQYRPLQVAAWTSTQNGYSSKLFLLTARTEDPWGTVAFGLQEIDPTDHNWTPGTDEKPLRFAPLTPITPNAIPMTGWAVAPYVFSDSGGTQRRIGIQVQFVGGLPDVTSVRIQVRENFGSNNIAWDSGEQAYDVTEPNPVTRVITWAGIVPNTSYQVRGQFISPPASGRPNTWSSWLSVTTANVAPMTAPEIIAVANNVLNQLGQVRTLIEQFKALGTLIEAQDRQNFTDSQTLSRSISSQVGLASASFTDAIQVATGPTSALATSIQSLYAALGGNTAQINVQWTVKAAVTGYSARYALQLAVNDGTLRTATMAADVPASPTDPTRWLFQADQFAIVTSLTGTLVVPFYISGANVYINNAMITNLTSSSINVADLFAQNEAVAGVLTVGSHITIDGPNGRIVVAD